MREYCAKEHFLDRLYGEYQAYKASVLGCPNTEIYNRSGEINAMEDFNRILSEKAKTLPEHVLTALLQRKNLLKELYESWLGNDDYGYDDMERYTEDEIENIVKGTGGWCI